MTDSQLTTRRPLRVCLVTREFVGLSAPSETGAALCGLAQAIAGEADSLTVLFVPPHNTSKEQEAIFQETASYYETYFLVRIEILRGSSQLLPFLYTNEKASLAVMHYLQENAFDVVYFALEAGLGYYSLLGKELATFRPRPRMIVVAHRPLAWCGEADGFFLEDLRQVGTAFMERYCAENADELTCPSESLLNWFATKGWSLPAHTTVLPDLRPREWVSAGEERRDKVVDELLFFGSTDYHSGLTLFCDTVDRLASVWNKPLIITLLGSFSRILGEHAGGLLLRRARKWPFEVRILTRYTPQEAADYLIHRRVLVVAPAFAAVSPFSISTCLEENVPFIATRVEAIPEMIDPRDYDRCLSEPHAASIAENIHAVLKNGARQIRPQYTVAMKRQAWSEYFDRFAAMAGASAVAETHAPPREEATPLVSVIMAHYNRPELVVQAIQSVERQDYPKIELVLVDDGSTRPEAHALLDRLEPSFAKRGWKILREKNRYLGAARNSGIRASTGEFVAFLDDDNILFDNAISTFISAMEAGECDICTCMSKLLYHDAVPSDQRLGFIHYFPLGGSLDLGYVHNSFGDANAVMRRSVFEKIGYLVEDYGFVAQDWEFFARAALEGLKVRIIPEALYWYRSNPKSMYRSAHWYATRKVILGLYKKYDLSRLEYIHHLILAQNVDQTDKEGYHYNLHFSLSDERMLKLKGMGVNSDEALDLLAEIAATDGRADTSLLLLAQRKEADLRRRALTQFSSRAVGEPALSESVGLLTTERVLTVEDLRSFVVRSARPKGKPPLSYVLEPDRLYIQAGRTVAFGVLTATFSAGVRSATAAVFIDQPTECRTEFMICLVPVDSNPRTAIAKSTSPQVLPLLGSSGWCGVERPYEVLTIEAGLATASDCPMNLVLAVRLAPEASGNVALGCFSYICEHRAVSAEAIRRPRLGAPPQKQRARLLTESELKTAKLVTQYPSPYAILKFVPGEEGIFLRPSEKGIVIAVLPWAFPSFARKIIATVEIAHEDASPFEFAMALTRPDEAISWTGDAPNNSVAFSGWLRVEERFELRRLTVEMREITRTFLALNIAIRLPPGSNPMPTQAFWRQFLVAWDD